MEFKKIENFLEELLDDKSRVIDLLAETEMPDNLFYDVDVHNSIFIGSKATLFIGLYVEIIKQITGIDFDSFKKDKNENVFLSEEIIEDIIIDIGKFLISLKNEKEIIKKYKSHTITVYDLKNILKWFEVCKNNKLRVLII